MMKTRTHRATASFLILLLLPFLFIFSSCNIAPQAKKLFNFNDRIYKIEFYGRDFFDNSIIEEPPRFSVSITEGDKEFEEIIGIVGSSEYEQSEDVRGTFTPGRSSTMSINNGEYICNIADDGSGISVEEYKKISVGDISLPVRSDNRTPSPEEESAADMSMDEEQEVLYTCTYYSADESLPLVKRLYEIGKAKLLLEASKLWEMVDSVD